MTAQTMNVVASLSDEVRKLCQTVIKALGAKVDAKTKTKPAKAAEAAEDETDFDDGLGETETETEVEADDEPDAPTQADVLAAMRAHSKANNKASAMKELKKGGG